MINTPTESCWSFAGYLHYNVVAKKLGKRLEALGGQQIVELGLGDDQHPIGFEAALDPWLTGLWRSLHGKHLLPDDVNDVRIFPVIQPYLCPICVRNVTMDKHAI
jgi:sulfite reductase alpha subunit-like flavoprotein